MSFPVKKSNSLEKWIVRKHGKLKGFLPRYNHENNNNNKNNIIAYKQLDQRIKLRRRQQRKQKLTLYSHKVVHEDLKEYENPYSISSKSNNNMSGTNDTIRIHTHNIDNMPIYATNVKNQLIIMDYEKKEADIHLWQEVDVC